jgi:predicted N-acetyltransferase YhbS
MKIRQATIADAFEIERVHRDAFGEAEGPVVATLAKELLNGIDDDRSIAFVAESDDRVVGAIIFSPLTISGGDKSRSMILAPLAVATAFQRQGIGQALVRYGLDNLKSQGIDFVFVYGNPLYYSRFGFSPNHQLAAPYKLKHPEAWMILGLRENGDACLQGIAVCVPPLMYAEHW